MPTTNPKLSTPATWSAVLATIHEAGQRGVTNAQIASHLRADVADVTQLTRLLWKAGEIDLRREAAAHVYTPNITTNTTEAATA